MWLICIVAAVHVALGDAVIPDPLTEEYCTACEQAVEELKAEERLCESTIHQGQVVVGGRIAGFKTYFTDVENQMKKLEPEKAKLANTLSNQYASEAMVYGDLRKEAAMTTAAFLHRRDSRADPMDRLMDRWLKCDDDRRGAEVKLKGCRTKAKTVEMWDAQRERQYKDKADVYIMRVSRQTDPLQAQLKESARLNATINRITQQTRSLNTERKEMRCPSTCSYPSCVHGEADNGGSYLDNTTIWGTAGCTHYCSRPYGDAATRYCGTGTAYTTGASVDCTRCAETN